MKFEPPEKNKKAFNCPHCNAYAHQLWYTTKREYVRDEPLINGLKIADCSHCNKYSVWVSNKLIYPEMANTPLPNEDLPDDIKSDYLEAASIVQKSPRGSAALLRLAIQKLCTYLGGSKEEDLNNVIADFVKRGLDPKIQRALDIVRVIGNEAVHPGQIDLKDDIKTATKLFELINIITEDMITKPKRINEMYSDLPNGKLEAINKRDSK